MPYFGIKGQTMRHKQYAIIVDEQNYDSYLYDKSWNNEVHVKRLDASSHQKL